MVGVFDNLFDMLIAFGQFTLLCIVYVVLNTLDCIWTLIAMLCIVYFFGIQKVLLHETNTTFEIQMKTYKHFFHSHYLTAWNQCNFWKTYEKNVYKCIGFLHEHYQRQAYTVVWSSNSTLNTTIQRLVWIDQL